VLTGAVDPLSKPLLFGLKKLAYLARSKGSKPISCPFDARRNGIVPGESAAMLTVEYEKTALKRKCRQYARILSINSCFDPRSISKVFPTGESIEKAINECIKDSGINIYDIDYISSCANSTIGLDKVEVKVLKRIFGNRLNKIPVSSIKSMTGETFSTAGSLQIISCIGAMEHSVIPPTINYKVHDPFCELDCVANKARKKKVNIALVVSSGPGGYNSACLLEKI
jgi:3-oxoacyl-(acyl-carrier-protein) synthase